MSTLIDPRLVFVIIPAYNENAVIGNVVTDLLLRNYSLVIVDDGSAKPVSSLIGKERLFLLRHRINLGQGAALQTGIEFALSKGAKYLVTFDADGQHHADDIDKLLDPLVKKRSVVVFGSRLMKGGTHNMPGGRKFMLHLARWLNLMFTGLLLSDAHNGLRAITRDAAKAIQIRENGMAHASELLLQVKKNKLRYCEIPVNISYTDYSLKKGQRASHGFRIFFDLLLNKLFK
jgi:glycosyltransferase involved in cell wall biosynthesis